MSALLLQFYVARRVIAGVMLAMTVIMVMILLIDFVELTRDIGAGSEVSPLQLGWLALLRAPSLAEATLPFVFLFGAMWGMYQLNRRSELVVMRAAGMSAWRFIAPGAVFALISGVLAVTLLSPLAVSLNRIFELERLALTTGSNLESTVVARSIWQRDVNPDGQLVIRARGVDTADGMLRNVTLFQYTIDAQGRPEFDRRFDADAAELRPGFLQLFDVTESAPDVEPSFRDSRAIPTNVDPGGLMNEDGPRGVLTVWELPQQIRDLNANGLSSVEYELRWLRLLTLPVTLLAMTLVASAASLRLSRRGGALQLTVLAALVGFGMYFGDEMLAAMGATRLLPLPLAATAAPLFTCFTALFVISTLEDG